jgi:hypothetical protein
MERSLAEELRQTLNTHTAEGGSNTPDFILAEYLLDCLAAFDRATLARDQWWGADSVQIRTGDGL